MSRFISEVGRGLRTSRSEVGRVIPNTPERLHPHFPAAHSPFPEMKSDAPSAPLPVFFLFDISVTQCPSVVKNLRLSAPLLS